MPFSSADVPFVAMKQVTLRMPEAGYHRLVLLSQRYGITFRGIFEAAATISFADVKDPERRESMLKIWDVARKLDQSPEFRAGPRRKVIARLCDSIAEQLADECQRFGVSQNATLCLITTPWPDEDTEAFHEYRRRNIHRIVELARELDWQHRHPG